MAVPAAAPATPSSTSATATTPATPSSTSAMAATPTTADASFDFDSFILRVKELNDAVAMQASKCEHKFDGTTLTLYPDKNITKTILARDGNKKILIEAGGGIKIAIGEIDGDSNSNPKDALISKISDIMGGKVENDGQGGNPF